MSAYETINQALQACQDELLELAESHLRTAINQADDPVVLDQVEQALELLEEEQLEDAEQAMLRVLQQLDDE